MKWTTEDIPFFINEREYIDTALIPLLPIDFGNGIRQSAAMSEFITVITAELERQFKGRVLLVPPFTYLDSENITVCRDNLEQWTNKMKEEMKHVILITADPSWKKVEADIEDLLVWMPLVPLENMESEYKRQVVSEQIKQLIPLIMDKWKSSP
ncbi:YpiF family protein [Alteribacillus sp. YIM 98480]|uniref:YpiF family protein n=1 Tax=Alteribacillus sp. YIM 98480 TaxID=2606599 RepID=UPI00131E38BF|nr:YpiF family protein [Alteribacillus sp. YIM 98480]